MVIREVLEAYKEDLLEPMLVLSHLLGVDRSFLFTHPDQELEEELVDRFKDIMARRQEGYPLQYLLKEREFMGLNLFIDEGVLVPRNDTEILVEYLIDYCRKRPGSQVLEIGLGSGAISLALGYYSPESKILGVDISPAALEVARHNLARFQLDNLEFIESDLFQEVEGDFDVIVSNPPYIASGDIGGLERQVRDYEPHLALDGGEDGLDFYREISSQAKNYLREKGLLIYEVGYNQARDVEKIMEDQGFVQIEILEDLQGYERVVLGIKG